MATHFYELDPKHLTGLGFRFWWRENISYINHETVNIVTNYYVDTPGVTTWNGWREWGMLVLLPLCYLLAVVIGPYLRKLEALEFATTDYETTFYNKKNIEYITIVHRLSGGKIGH